jgi:Flp pilus assembly protein TadD
MRKLAILGCVILLTLTGCETTSTKNTDTASIALADTALKERNIPKAIELYQAALLKNPFNVEIKNKLAACYLLQNNIPQALKIYQTVLSQDKKNLTALRGISRAYMLKADAAAARPYLEQVVSLDATSNNISALGVVYDMLGNHKEAQQQYDIALEKDPNDVTILNNKGFSLLMTADYKSAISILEKLALQETATQQQWGNFALALVLNNQEEKAAAFLSKKLSEEEKNKSMLYFQDTKQHLKKGASLQSILFSKQ